MEVRKNLKKFFGHLGTVIKHRHYVSMYCFACGLYRQGILHDLSKYSPTEFFESVKYWTGNKSPIDICKKSQGYSKAWLHHRGRNKHHWEYWVDDFEKGTRPIKMPFKYALEMICDFLGAGRAYNGDKFSMVKEIRWWESKREVAVLHHDTRKLVDCMFLEMEMNGILRTLSDKAFLENIKDAYDNEYL